MSVSAVVPEKSRGNKKCDEGEEAEERQNFGLLVLCATFLISMCSFCRGQHADGNRPT